MFKNHVTQDDLKTIDRIRKDCGKLHILQPPTCFLSYELLDADGKQIESHNMLSKSWVRNFYNYIAANAMGVVSSALPEPYGPGSLVIGGGPSNQSYIVYPSDPSGTSADTKPGRISGVLGAANVDSYGILVGSSDEAESFESIGLGSKILSGAVAGKISYQQQENPSIEYDPASKKYTTRHSRFFNNNSGSDIVIKEIGWSRYLGWYLPYAVFIARDVLPSPITVPNAGQFKVTYTVEMVYPD